MRDPLEVSARDGRVCSTIYLCYLLTTCLSYDPLSLGVAVVLDPQSQTSSVYSMLGWLNGSFQVWSDMYHMLSGRVLLYPCIASASNASSQGCECSSAYLGTHYLLPSPFASMRVGSSFARLHAFPGALAPLPYFSC